MRTLAQIISGIALLGAIWPAAAYLAGTMTLDSAKLWMLIATVAWFVTVPVWMGRKKANEEGGMQNVE